MLELLFATCVTLWHGLITNLDIDLFHAKVLWSAKNQAVNECQNFCLIFSIF